MTNSSVRWEKVLTGIVSVFFTLIVGMIVFFVNQYDKRLTSAELDIKDIRRVIELNNDNVNDKLNSIMNSIGKLETKIDMLGES